MIKKKNITEVSKFAVSDNHLSYLQGNRLVINQKTVVVFETASGDIFVNKNLVIWQNYTGDFDIYSLEGELVTNRKGYFNYLAKRNGGIFYFDTDNDSLKLVQIVDPDISFIRIKSNGLIDLDFFFEIRKNALFMYSLTEDRLVFAYTLPESKYEWHNLGNVYISERSIAIKAEIKKILGVYNRVVYLTLNSGVVLGLDVRTGEEKVSIRLPSRYPNPWNEKDLQIYTVDLIEDIDIENGILFGFLNRYYGEIDLNTENKTFSIIDINESDRKLNGLRIGSWKGDEIFFYQWSFAQDPSYVGIFNRNTREITWTSRDLGDEGVFKGINKVEYSGNRLYVLDRANTLHVFER